MCSYAPPFLIKEKAPQKCVTAFREGAIVLAASGAFTYYARRKMMLQVLKSLLHFAIPIHI
jgi:hypothetical protein